MKNEKTRAIIYWIATGLLAFGMLLGGIGQLSRAKFNVDGITHLGYPLYVLSIIGSWKILGVVAILMPKFPLIKEWAYAGFFFVLSGAVISHLACGDGAAGAAPSFVFACLTLVSRHFRFADRKLNNGTFS